MSTEVEEPTDDPVKGEQFVSMAQARMVCRARKQCIDELKAENEELKGIISQLEKNLVLKSNKVNDLEAENEAIKKELAKRGYDVTFP